MEDKFEVGESVYIRGRYNISKDIIISITKAGNYKTKDNGIYTSDGYARGGSSWSRPSINKIDDEGCLVEIEKMKKKSFIYTIQEHDYSKKSLKELTEIIELITRS